MAYKRRDVKDNITVMNKDLYDNLQDGIEEAKAEIQKLVDEKLPEEVKTVVLSDILVLDESESE